MQDKITKPNRELKAEIKPGDTVRVIQIISGFGTDKQKTQAFEGLVLAHKHGKEPGATITVRGIIDGVAVEKIFPLYSPIIKQINLVKKGKVRRAKLYYLRGALGKRAKIKSEMVDEKVFEETAPVKQEEAPTTEKAPQEEVSAVEEQPKQETPVAKENIPEKEEKAEPAPEK